MGGHGRFERLEGRIFGERFSGVFLRRDQPVQGQVTQGALGTFQVLKPLIRFNRDHHDSRLASPRYPLGAARERGIDNCAKVTPCIL